MISNRNLLRSPEAANGGGSAKIQAIIGRSRSLTHAKGSCGEVNITTVPPKTAAMLMAIVADELKAPLNELRFISIKEKGSR